MPEDSASIRPTETRKLAAIMFTDIVGLGLQFLRQTRRLRMVAPSSG